MSDRTGWNRRGGGSCAALIAVAALLASPGQAGAQLPGDEDELERARLEALDRATTAWIASLPARTALKRAGCTAPGEETSWQSYAAVPRDQGPCGACYIVAPVGLLEVQRAIDCCDALSVSEGRCRCEMGYPGCVCPAGDPGCETGVHIPTATEIRITVWPGEYRLPRVYDDRVLLGEHTGSDAYSFNLWDCSLPATDTL